MRSSKWQICPFQGRNLQMCFKGLNEHSKEVSNKFWPCFLLINPLTVTLRV